MVKSSSCFHGLGLMDPNFNSERFACQLVRNGGMVSWCSATTCFLLRTAGFDLSLCR
jgi:hypothetical protein